MSYLGMLTACFALGAREPSMAWRGPREQRCNCLDVSTPVCFVKSLKHCVRKQVPKRQCFKLLRGTGEMALKCLLFKYEDPSLDP